MSKCYNGYMVNNNNIPLELQWPHFLVFFFFNFYFSFCGFPKPSQGVYLCYIWSFKLPRVILIINTSKLEKSFMSDDLVSKPIYAIFQFEQRLDGFSITSWLNNLLIQVGKIHCKIFLQTFQFRFTVIGLVSYGDDCGKQNHAGESS